MINAHQLQHLLQKIPTVRVAVIGDFCLDAYYFLDPSAARASVETGLLTQPVRAIRFVPGGAGTIVNNLVSIGAGAVSVFGIVGDDLFGREMTRLFSQARVNTESLKIQPEGWNTHVYSKLYEHGRELPRVDVGDFNAADPQQIAELLADLRAALPQLDVVIVNQQIKHGIHTDVLIAGLVRLAAETPDVTFIADSRDFADQYTGVIHKLNNHEAARIIAPDAAPHAPGAHEMARRLFRRWGSPVFLTRGEDGCVVCTGDELHTAPGLHIAGPTDTVGAGDSLLAGIAAALGAGFSPPVAAEFGNLLAGVTVQKLMQTGTASPAEVRAIHAGASYRLRPDIAAAEPRNFYRNSRIEIVSTLPEMPDFKCAVFDHDGTISVLRQGWDDLMAEVMVRSILGERAASAEPAQIEQIEQIEQTVHDFIAHTNGRPTIQQMEGLVGFVRDFGFVPESEILTAAGYKAIFNEKLLQRVRSRAGRIHAGEMEVPDFTIKNAVPFLAALAERGVTLFLASGTDETDVRREAELMGYAHYFGGGIFGARPDDPAWNPKRFALERACAEAGPEPAQRVVCFGDGPAEMRETRRTGGLAVGIASDEIRRHGLNRAKRRRLVLAGADLVIPDFSQMNLLLDLLF